MNSLSEQYKDYPWVAKFHQLCLDAWSLGQIDICGPVLVNPSQLEEIKTYNAHHGLPFITYAGPDPDYFTELHDRVSAGKWLMNIVTGSEMEVVCSS